MKIKVVKDKAYQIITRESNSKLAKIIDKISKKIFQKYKNLYRRLEDYDKNYSKNENFELELIEDNQLTVENNPEEIIAFIESDLIKFNRELTGNGLVRDRKLLSSALANPFSSFGGSDLYETIFDKAGQLCFGLIKNHPFIDGNKRTAIHALLVFLELNKIEISLTEDELYKVVIAVAENNMNNKDLINWLKSKYNKGEKRK